MDNDLFIKKPWLKEITIEELNNEDLEIMSSLIGAEAVITLVCNMPGFIVTIPQKVEIYAKNKYIKRHYDGTKKARRKLAVECGVTEGYIYKIARKKDIKL